MKGGIELQEVGGSAPRKTTIGKSKRSSKGIWLNTELLRERRRSLKSPVVIAIPLQAAQ
jgi:hypothetical protein